MMLCILLSLASALLIMPWLQASSASLKISGVLKKRLTQPLQRQIYIESLQTKQAVLCPGDVARKLFYYVGFTVQATYQLTPNDPSCMKVSKVVFLKVPGGREAVQGLLQRETNKGTYYISATTPLVPTQTSPMQVTTEPTPSSSTSQRQRELTIYRFGKLSPTLESWHAQKRRVILDLVPDITREGFYKIAAYYSYPDLGSSAAQTTKTTIKKALPK